MKVKAVLKILPGGLQPARAELGRHIVHDLTSIVSLPPAWSVSVQWSRFYIALLLCSGETGSGTNKIWMWLMALLTTGPHTMRSTSLLSILIKSCFLLWIYKQQICPMTSVLLLSFCRKGHQIQEVKSHLVPKHHFSYGCILSNKYLWS